MEDEVLRRSNRNSGRLNGSQRRAVYVDPNEAFHKRSGIYVDRLENTEEPVTMVTESTPLINNRTKYKKKLLQDEEKYLKKQIYKQITRQDETTQNLIEYAENMNNETVENFQKVKTKKKKSKSSLLCCCHGNSED
ncbi:hypothetical protein ACF0H5_015215 [Mactra antiquata]